MVTPPESVTADILLSDSRAVVDISARFLVEAKLRPLHYPAEALFLS